VLGEVVTERPINNDPAQFTCGLGVLPTPIDQHLPFEHRGPS